jgi:GON domain-containing protein
VVKRLFRHSLPILALSVVPLAVATMPAQAAPAPGSSVQFYSSCADIHRHLVKAPDGDYVLYNNGNLFTVYCDDMSAMPREYIDLVKTWYGSNFSQYTAGGASPGTNVRTSFTKLRINPANLTVDIGDLTFASSTGSLRHSGRVKVSAMPYGVAMSCTAPQDPNGTGNIDLRYTPFQVNNAFTVGGAYAKGSATVTQDKQLVSLAGGGYCGWIAPAPGLYNPFNPKPGMYDLKLSCASGHAVAPPGQVCLRISGLAGLTERAGQGGAENVLYHGSPVTAVNRGGQVQAPSALSSAWAPL